VNKCLFLTLEPEHNAFTTCYYSVVYRTAHCCQKIWLNKRTYSNDNVMTWQLIGRCPSRLPEVAAH